MISKEIRKSTADAGDQQWNCPLHSRLYCVVHRCMLLDQLYNDLTKSTELMCGSSSHLQDDALSASSMSDLPKEGSSGFFEAFKVRAVVT